MSRTGFAQARTQGGAYSFALPTRPAFDRLFPNADHQALSGQIRHAVRSLIRSPAVSASPARNRIVVHLRNAYRLRSHRQRLLDSGLLTVCELARHLDVHFQTVKHWRRDGIITGVLANDKGEYLYPLPGPDLVRPIIGRPRKSVLDPEHSATTR